VPQPAYDIIIAGGGMAGLSLAYRLAQKPELQAWQVLVVDQQFDKGYDKTWCFWTQAPQRYRAWASAEWPSLTVAGPQGNKTQALAPYRYLQVRSGDFYRQMLAALDAAPNITLLATPIENLQTQDRQAILTTPEGQYRAAWAFNSLLDPAQIPATALTLKQHFLGYRLRSEHAAFRPDAATLMDFDLPQKGQVRFCYVLPYSPQEALVEFTVFSQQLLARAEYEAALEHYLQRRLGVSSYSVQQRELGVIPMTDYAFPRWPSPRVRNIGTAGGFTKPSTGYTFANVQADTQALADQLAGRGHPRALAPPSPRYRFYDQLLLELIQNRPAEARQSLQALLLRNPLPLVLKFLDEQTTPAEEVQLFAQLPWGYFLQALYRRRLQPLWC
jgi:lycopene beta-cyclase